MKTSRLAVVPLAFVLWLGSGGGAATAQDAGPPPAAPESPANPFIDGLVDEFLSTLRRLLRAIPQYEMPEIGENGDIIIRRKRPEPEADKSRDELEAVET